MQKVPGRILKGIGGFYYVETKNGIVECKARGALRNREVTPCVGDSVSVEFEQDTMKGVITAVLPRKNQLIRPAVSNIDKLYIVCSTVLPQPNLLNIDKLIAIALHSGIDPIIVISKTDMQSSQQLRGIYEKAGFRVFQTSKDDSDSVKPIKESLKGKISVFTGNSGVGKSTLINTMFPGFALKTGEVSQKLSRGRHTTRHVELFALPDGGYIADTPGFSSIDFEVCAEIKKDEVIKGFPDFKPYVSNCRFPDCCHIGETDCSLKAAVENEEALLSRYQSYCTLYKEAEKIKDWEKRQKRGNK